MVWDKSKMEDSKVYSPKPTARYMQCNLEVAVPILLKIKFLSYCKFLRHLLLVMSSSYCSCVPCIYISIWGKATAMICESSKAVAFRILWDWKQIFFPDSYFIWSRSGCSYISQYKKLWGTNHACAVWSCKSYPRSNLLAVWCSLKFVGGNQPY